MPLARVTVTLPPQLVAAADDSADRHGISRSAVVTDALQKYYLESNQAPIAGRVSEPAGAAYTIGLSNEVLLAELSRRLGAGSRTDAGIASALCNGPRLWFDPERLAAVCRRHHVEKLSLFGSVLTDAFSPDSDVDVLVEFEPGRTPGLAIIDLEDELSTVFGGRRVDLVTPRSLHPLIREQLMASAALQFAA